MEGAPEAAARETPELALRVLLLVLLLDASLFWFQRVPLQIACGLALVLPGLARDWRSWAVLGALTAWPLFWNWPFSDNHDYLRALAVLAVTLALTSAAPARVLRTSARLLLGGTFFFATLWKLVLSPDFLDGSFFRVTLLADARFHDLAVLAGGASWETLDAFDAALSDFLTGRGIWPGAFVEPAGLRPLALALTLYTGVLEAAIAAAFLWPRLARFRNVALILFGATTFAFATVRGFGWLLMALGLAQCERHERGARAAYLATLFLIELYRSVPWGRMLVDALGPG
jgi:hypothetical protein